MDYHEAADFLFDLRRFQVKPGTESVRALLSALGDPHEGVEFVQVAGSNGKGSTARMVESTLREAGYRVGLYTSPHFDDVRERVRVDGRKMTRSAVSEFVEEAKPFLVERAAGGEPLTFFETVTAMGLWYFGRADVDAAVLEVGLGGRYDATSVVDPVASAVTNVSLEHTGVLGDTVVEIATRKAHVAPDERPLVTAATGEALEAIESHAGEVVTVGDDGDVDVDVEYGGRVNRGESAVTVAGDGWRVETRIPLLGAHQARNAGVAAALARAAADVDEVTLARGLRSAHWPGRFEVIADDPLVVLDGAHNPEACERVGDVLAEFEFRNLHLVFGAMHDKDHQGMVAALPAPDTVETCAPDLERAEDPEVLAAVFADERSDADVRAGGSVATALARARERADAGDCVLVVGSLFCVGEARTEWRRVEVPKRVDDVETAREVLESANVTDAGVWRMRGKAVHRVMRTRVQRRQAQYLKEEMLSLDGECAVSGVETSGELVDVVLMGTLAQFKRLTAKLDGQPWGLSSLAAEVRETVGIDAGRPRHGYPWEERPCVMGILNVTPDSFHDGGRYEVHEDAVARAEEMVEAGADVVDVGGESTRPGAEPVSADEETARVVPVIEALADLDVAVSIDTRKAEVGRAALDAGADILNDVTGLADPEMRFLAADRDVPLVVMHSIDAPVVPGKDVAYDDVVEDVIDELAERVLLAEKAGLDREKVIVDPGFGFGKAAEESFELLGRVDEFAALGCPVLVGHSHKSMFGLADRGSGDHSAATVAGTALAVDRGADIVRVHDVEENVAALRTALAADDPDAEAFSTD